jgi:hypothetical protein
VTGPAAEAAVAIGDRVYYSGSLEHRWGRYRLAAVVETDFDGTRYELATYDGEIALENVRRESFRSIEGPMHRVTALQTRLIAVERMALEKYGEVPDYLVFSMRCVPVVIERGRPAEAEHYLLSLEVSVGCISQDYFQDAASKVQILGDDNSWSTNWTQAELDELRRQYHPSWKKE